VEFVVTYSFFTFYDAWPLWERRIPLSKQALREFPDQIEWAAIDGWHNPLGNHGQSRDAYWSLGSKFHFHRIS
jgi:hypothetical protein